jgi:hypothetical protein
MPPCCSEEETLFRAPNRTAVSLDCPSRSLVTIPAELFRLPFTDKGEDIESDLGRDG